MPRWTTQERAKMGLDKQSSAPVSGPSGSPMPEAYWEKPSQAPAGYTPVNQSSQQPVKKAVSTMTEEFIESNFKPKAQTNFTPRMGLPNVMEQNYPNRRDFVVGAVASFEGAFYGLGSLVTAIPQSIISRRLTFGNGWSLNNQGLTTPDLQPTGSGALISSAISGVQGKGWSPEAQAIWKKGPAFIAGSIVGDIAQTVVGSAVLSKGVQIARGGSALKIAAATERETSFVSKTGYSVSKRTTDLIITKERIPLSEAKRMKNLERFIKPDTIELGGTQTKLTKVSEVGTGSKFSKIEAGGWEDLRAAEPYAAAAKQVTPKTSLLKTMVNTPRKTLLKSGVKATKKSMAAGLEDVQIKSMDLAKGAKYVKTAKVTDRTVGLLTPEGAMSRGSKVFKETGFGEFNVISQSDRVITGVRMTGKIDSQVYLDFVKNVPANVSQKWLTQMGGVTQQQLTKMAAKKVKPDIWLSMKAVGFEVSSGSDVGLIGSAIPFAKGGSSGRSKSVAMPFTEISVRQDPSLKDYAAYFAAQTSDSKAAVAMDVGQELAPDIAQKVIPETIPELTYQKTGGLGFPMFPEGGGDISIGGPDPWTLHGPSYYKRGRKKWRTTKPRDLLKTLL